MKQEKSIQKIIYWFRTEYQRAVALLPKLLIHSTVIAVIMGVVLTAFVMFIEEQEDSREKVRIGYVAEKDMVTRLLVSYVKNLDSVEGWCKFVSVTEEEGKEQLQEGELAALLILPEHVVDEILSGSNAPATLILPKQSSALGIVFEELADAGIRMLSVAQAEIYTVYELVDVLGLSKEQLLAICENINEYNLGLAMNREDLFQQEKISVTGNEGIAVYYGSAILTILWLVCGGMFGRYIKHSEQEQLLMWKRIGISPVIQTIGRMLIMAMLLIAVLLPIMGLWVLPWVRDMLIPIFTWQSFMILVVSAISLSAYYLFIYQLSEQHRIAIVLLGLLAVVQAYLSGCLIPEMLLPEVIQKISSYIPAAYIRKAFSMSFTGETVEAADVCVTLALIGLCLTGINILLMYQKTRNYAIGSSSQKTSDKRRSGCLTGTVFGIYAKRLMYRKSFWCSLVLMILVSVGLVSLEKESQTTIPAAFYDESGKWEELLCEYEGYIKFQKCNSQEEVKQLVLYNEVECGYVLTNELEERVLKQEMDASIIVYEDSDALMTDTVNEILFEQLFNELSKKWFAENMSEDASLLPVLEQKLTDGSTFSVKKEYWKTETQESVSEPEERTTYPVYLAIIFGIFLCGLSGMWEAIEDYQKYHFFNRNGKVMVFVSIFQPVICGILVGIVIFLLNSY